MSLCVGFVCQLKKGKRGGREKGEKKNRRGTDWGSGEGRQGAGGRSG